MNELLIILLIVIIAIYLLILTLLPKLIPLTLWPVIMVYPHSVTYGYLPLNIGFDDLYIGIVFLCMTLRKGLPPFKFPIKSVIVFYLITVFANISGLLEAPSSAQTEIIKAIIKNLGLIMFAWSILISIDNETDVKRHIFVFLGSFAVASIIATLDHFGFAFAQLFYIVEEEFHFRAYGPFLSPAGIGMNTQISLFISILGLSCTKNKRYAIYCGIVAAAIGSALLVSGSRSGWIGAMSGFLVMILTAKKKGVIFLLAIILFAVMIPILGYQEIKDIIEINTERTIYGVGAHGAGRLERWVETIKNPYPTMLFCGRGAVAQRAIVSKIPHNGYLSVLFLYGLCGTIFISVILWRILKTSFWLSRYDYDPLFSTSSMGIFLGVVACFFVAIPADPIISTFWRYSLFFVIAILWARLDQLSALGFDVPYKSRSIDYNEGDEA
ncbi:MAG: O-antigen ligase family protein [Planctomycetota bacterium]|jgi:hypothetical protein